MSERHSGHARRAATSGFGSERSSSAATGLRIKKYTTAAMIRNVSSAFMKWP
jgi:hypothetical protein